MSITALLTVVIVAQLQLVADSYLLLNMYRIVGLNFNKPKLANQEWEFKRVLAHRGQFKNIFLGNSRVNHGFDFAQWPANLGPVVNLGSGAQSYHRSYELLQMAYRQSAGDLKRVFFFVDFFQYRKMDPDTVFEVEDEPGSILFLLKNVLTLSGLNDSLTTIWHNLRYLPRESCSPRYTGFNPVTGANCTYKTATRDSLERVMFEEKVYCEVYQQTELDNDYRRTTLSQVKQIIDFTQNHGVDLKIVMAPLHVRHLAVIEASGKWTEYEDFKKKLLGLVESSSRAELWDFSDLSSRSTSIFGSKHDPVNPYFFESTHFKANVGGDVLRELLEQESPLHLGVRLTAENLESQLVKIRAHYDAWKAESESQVSEIEKNCALARPSL